MAINTFAYAQIFQQQLDKQVVAKATSGWMEGNAGLVKYSGGNTIKIPKMNMDGLGNYSRDNGFVQGSATLSYETETLTQDRGRTFQLDSMDVDETNFVPTASALMSEFQRTKVIPEIDAYRYSKIAALAIAANANASSMGGYTPAVGSFDPTASASTIFKAIRADIAAIQDVAGAIPLVITISTATLNILENSPEIQRQLQVAQFPGGADVSFEVKSIDNCPIMEVPSARLKTVYDFNDGSTTGQTAGGFAPDATAKTINWIICGQNVPIAVSKTDKIRIFDPETNQKADAWKIDYRKYHDLWIPDNQFQCLRVNIKEALS